MQKQFEEPEDVEFEDTSGPILDDGWYLATFENYEVLKKVVDKYNPEGVDKVKMWFKIDPADNPGLLDETKYISTRANRKWGARSSLKKLVCDMLGKDVNDPMPLHLKPLRGVRVDLLVGTSTDGRYSNIDKIRPAKPKQATIKGD